MISPPTSLVAAAASPAIPRPSRGRRLLHVRPHRRAVRQRHPLVGAAGCSASTQRHHDDDYPPIFADQVHSLSPVPLCVVAAPKLDQIGDEQAQKEAQHRDRRAFDDQRHAAAVRATRRVATRRAPRRISRTSSLRWKSSAGPESNTRRVSGPWCRCAADLRAFRNRRTSCGRPARPRRRIGRRRRAARATARRARPSPTTPMASATLRLAAPAKPIAPAMIPHRHAGAERRPEIGPERVHALSR